MRIILAFAFEAVDSGGLFLFNVEQAASLFHARTNEPPKTGWQPVLHFPRSESFF